MDGTLLNSQKELHPDFSGILKILNHRNIQFAVASGRQYYTLYNDLAPKGDGIIYVAENGTFIVKDQESIYIKSLNQLLANKVIAETRLLEGAWAIVCGRKAAYIENDSPILTSELNKYYVRNQRVDDLTKVDDDILKIAVLDPLGAESQSYEKLKHLNDQMQVSVSGEIWLDVMAEGANKGTAIAFLQEYLGVGYNETMIFGDYLNDLEMMATGYYSFAMENAHPKLKEVARFETHSNDQNGVLRAIRKVLLCGNPLVGEEKR